MKNILFRMILAMIPITGFSQILQQDFESGTYPPTDWILFKTNANENWKLESDSPINGVYSASINYDDDLGSQNEGLISPAMNLTDFSSVTLTFNLSLSYAWAVDPNNNYDVTVAVTTDGNNFIPVWTENDLGVFNNFAANEITVDLSDYAGFPSVRVAFVYEAAAGNAVDLDAAAVYLDDIVVTGIASTFPSPYCGRLTSLLGTAPISRVIFADIDNSSNPALNGSPAHQDFTSIIGNVEQGQTIDISIEGNTYGNATRYFTVFIDWNQDNAFDEATERYEIGTITNSDGTDGKQVTGTIDVPADAVEGETRMRVISRILFHIQTSCTNTYSGQAEDYTVNVSPPFTAPYCGPLEFSSIVLPITRVVFADIDNSSDATIDGVPEHEDFTNVVGNVEQGQTIDVALEGTTRDSFSSSVFTVFVDWNQDELFDETTERYEIGTLTNPEGTGGQPVTSTIDVPADAVEGETRMRVISNYNSSVTDSCTGSTGGQAEDYTLNVSASTTGGNNCEQGVASNSLERAFPFAGSNNQRLAADIDVDANTNFTINSIQINTRETATYFDVIFYEDNAGLPGNEIATFMAVTKDDGVLIGTGSSGSSSGREFYRYTLTLTSPVLEGGNDGAKYWMEIKSDANAWEATNAYSLGENVAYSANSTGNEWTAGSNEVIYDLYGTCEASNTVSAFPAPYCGPLEFLFAVEPITRVIFADINNSSDPTKNGSPSHEDFTTIVANVEQGQTIDVALEGNTDGDYKDSFTVFVDWNQDELFDETTERYDIGTITNSDGTDGQQATGTIDVPADAIEGETRMRVIKRLGDYVNSSCSAGGFGQAEDYTVNVTASTTTGGNGCEQGVASNSQEEAIPFGGETNIRLAVDIDVDAGINFTINSIELNTVGMATNFDIIFYEDNAGVPGNEIANFTAVTQDAGVIVGNNSGFDFYRYTLTLTSPVLNGGSAGSKYWMEVVTDALAWEVTSDTSLGNKLVGKDDTNDWTLSDQYEGVYDLYGTCETLGVSDLDNTQITFYPNPVKDILNISFKNEISNIAIYNIAGQQVMAAKLNTSNGQVNMASLPSGIYVVRAQVDDNVKTFKVIKK